MDDIGYKSPSTIPPALATMILAESRMVAVHLDDHFAFFPAGIHMTVRYNNLCQRLLFFNRRFNLAGSHKVIEKIQIGCIRW